MLRSSLSDAALKNLPLVVSAIEAMVSGSAGTDTSRPPTLTVPSAVPKAMVEIGTPWLAASCAAPDTGRPTVGTPSDRRTMADPPLVVGAAPAVSLAAARASRAVEVAPPARSGRRDLGQQSQVGEADGGVAAAVLHPEIDADQGGHQQQQGQAPRSEEVHRRCLRAATKRTMSKSQSRSVDRTRWAAPVPRTARTFWAWRARAASAKRVGQGGGGAAGGPAPLF